MHIYIKETMTMPDRYGSQGAVNVLDAPVRSVHVKGWCHITSPPINIYAIHLYGSTSLLILIIRFDFDFTVCIYISDYSCISWLRKCFFVCYLS